jgi:WhiB family redox-sensing transcriptional regulator
VLDRADKFDPANRRLIILPPGKPPRTSAKNYILFEIATNLLALGRTAITGDELLEEIKITAGVTDPMPIWRMVTGKQTQYIRLIDSEMFGSKTAHTNYTVHPYYKSAVEDLLGTITSLKTDPAARLKAFRFSLMLPTRPAVLTYLWGKAMRKTVAETAGLKRAADDALAGMQKYFKSVPSHREWYTKAACLGLDPEQFFTIKKEEAQGAKKICQMCEVRMQCLNYSITHHEDYGIWGGYSAEEREKLPLTVRQELNSINML